MNGDGKADITCNDKNGNHWALLSNGDGTFFNKGNDGKFLSNWCVGSNKQTSYGDINGDGTADMICDDLHTGTHIVKLMIKG